jgi:predicted metalloprotease
MSSLIRPRLFVVSGLALVALIAATQLRGGTSAHAGEQPHQLSLGTQGSAQPQTMDAFLTAVTKDVDAYWTKVFADNNLPEPRVGYRILKPGETGNSACGQVDDTTAAYCQGDDTITVAEQFADGIYSGSLDRALPGSSQGFGSAAGDFAVAYVVAHEYGHQIQDELGVFDRNLPTEDTELQADCYAGNWAKSAYDQNRLEDGDIQEALDAALAVGDFDTANPGHHGTPEQREEAWSRGFESGDPDSCATYLEA